MDKKRQRATYPLVNIPSQPDLVKRLKCAPAPSHTTHSCRQHVDLVLTGRHRFLENMESACHQADFWLAHRFGIGQWCLLAPILIVLGARTHARALARRYTKEILYQLIVRSGAPVEREPETRRHERERDRDTVNVIGAALGTTKVPTR